MANALTNTFRLVKAGVVLAGHGIRFVPKGQKVPVALHAARWLTAPLRLLSWPFRIGKDPSTRLSDALATLGPSYIKLGQFLATRGDIIGPELATDLKHLQDKLPPFAMSQAESAIHEALGQPAGQIYTELGAPVAAASIAQVHKARATVKDKDRDLAVKILRPNIEKRFKRDLDSYFFAARQVERFHPPTRRLKPIAVVDNLARTTQLEMDLRLEAAAMSEMAENIARHNETPETALAFRVPDVDWSRTSKRVLTTEWIDGTPISDHATLKAKGFDLKDLGLVVLRSFLTHAMHDGFFHADMHQGNLFVDDNGTVVAVDFGIMGRLGPKERRFLAEILHGLITRDYQRAAEVHFWAGYVPPHHPVEVFAQALRAIGEPIQGRGADEISMADLLGQLFAYTEVFDMETRPELILLQKSLVIVEGVARELDPKLNLWNTAEPVAKAWMEQNLGVSGRLRDVGDGATTIARVMAEVPALINQAQTAATGLTRMAQEGVHLDDDTVRALAKERARVDRPWRWSAALSLITLASLAVAKVTGILP